MITSDYNYLEEAILDYLNDRVVNWKLKYEKTPIKYGIIKNNFADFYFKNASNNSKEQKRSPLSLFLIPRYIELNSGTRFYSSVFDKL